MTRTNFGLMSVLAITMSLLACDRQRDLSTQLLHPSDVIPNVTTLAASTQPHREYRVLQDRPDRLLVELPNGLIVLAAETHTAAVVSTQVWIKTGSIYEQEHAGAGLSHFLEHLISGGSTTTRDESQSTAILATIGAQTNAATSLDTVHYYINAASAYTDQTIDLLSDWMLNSRITQAEYDRERSVIQREFEMGQGEPSRILWKLTQKARYTRHPARHPTIGYLDEFLTITRDEIYDFYKRMYVPNNMVFVVVGDIDRHSVVNQIAQRWHDAKRQPLPPVRFPLDDTATGPKDLHTTADIDQPRMRLAWPGTRLAGEGDYALDLLASILGQGESSRLNRTVRDQQRAVNRVSAYNLSFPWGQGYFGIDANIAVPPVASDTQMTLQSWRKEHVARATEAILQQINQIIADGITSQELERAKRKTMASVIYEAQSAQQIANRLAGDLIGMKDPDYLKRYAQAIQSVTAEAVQKAAAKFLVPSALIHLTMNPQSNNDQPATLARAPHETWDRPSGGSETVNLDNSAIVQQLSKSKPTDADKNGVIRVDAIQRHVLDNGLRVLIGRSNVVPAVSMQIYQLGGLLADPAGQAGIGNAMATMRIKGTANRSASQIAQQIEGLGASLGTYCGYNSIYSKAVCLKDDWIEILSLLADVTISPSFPADEWTKMQPRLLAQIDQQSDTWNGELRQHFRTAYFGHHPWSTTPLGQTDAVRSLAPQDLIDFHKNHLSASDSVLVIFGDVQPQQVLKHVKQLFAALPTKPLQALHIANPPMPTATVNQFKTSKPLAAVQVGFGPTAKRQSDDYPALSVLAAVMSRFPSGWLEQELRGRGPGLVYAVGAGQFTGLVPGYFALLFNCQPDAVDEALRRSMTVIDRARNGSIDEASLAAAKVKVLSDEAIYKQTNSARAADAAINELYHLGLDEPARFRQAVQALDAQELQTVAKTYLHNPVTVVISHEPLPQEVLQQAVAGESQPVTPASK